MCEILSIIVLHLYVTDNPPPPDASLSVTALNEPGKVKVSWSRPLLGPGQEITGYSVQYRTIGSTSYTTCSMSSFSTTSYIIADLNLGTMYEVRVASVGPLGPSGCCYGNGKLVTTYNSKCGLLPTYVAIVVSFQ